MRNVDDIIEGRTDRGWARSHRLSLVLGNREHRNGVSEVSSSRGTFLEQLTRRKLAQWMLGYLAMAWLLLQLTDILSGIWSWPLWLQQVISVILGLGSLPAFVVSWYHGERGRQELCKIEIFLLVTLVAVSSAVVWSIFRGETMG